MAGSRQSDESCCPDPAEGRSLVTPALAARRHSSEYAAVRRAKGRTVGSGDPSPIDGSLTHSDHLAGVGSVRLRRQRPRNPDAWRRTVAWAASRNGRVWCRRRRADPAAGANADLRRRHGVGDLRWWPGASPSFTSGPIPFHVAFVVDRLLLRSTPVGGTLGKNSGKFDFGLLFAGQALSFPQAGPLKVRPACFGK